MINTTFDVVGVGNPIVDVLANVNEDFLKEVGGEKGGMVLVDSDSLEKWIAMIKTPISQSAGGSAGNTTFALARLGLNATFVGKIGNDASGKFYQERFAQLGGNPKRFKKGTVPNGRCLSLITPDSERTMRTDLGAAATLTANEVSPADFTGCNHAHIEGYLLFNPELMVSVLKAAQSANCTISVDLASFEVVNAAKPILGDLISEYVDLVFANEEEAEAFCGNGLSYEEMALQINKLCTIAVVKAGTKGSYIARDGVVIHSPAIQGIKAVDTTGAGDFWAAGFLFGYLRGKPLEICGHYGSVMGAAVVQTVGTELNAQTWTDIQKTLA